MTERAEEIEAFLVECGWQDAIQHRLAGDLSNRRYFRLTKGASSAILMDADTSMLPFLKMTRWLSERRYSVPTILAERAGAGLILLEDFGDVSVNAYLSKTHDETEIDALCVDLLCALRGETPPELDKPAAKTLVGWTQMSDAQYYPITSKDALDPFRETLRVCLQGVLKGEATVSLRDFHAENLMWLEKRHGIRKLGLLDYQDAFLTHPCYDLVSYLTDARTDITQIRREKVLNQYIARTGDKEDAFRLAFAAFSAQRNLRILEIFARSAAHGKAHHLSKLPRVHAHLVEALQHEAFRDIRDRTLAALSDPNDVVKAMQ